jgi:pimeloyl-ACP methyl ester carboxylesterase
MSNHDIQTSIDLYSESSGSGSPVLLVHGFGANTYTWHEFVPALRKNHRVIALDLKGFGKSPKPRDSAYSAFDQAGLLLRLIEQNHLQELILVGHSFGGAVSLVAALHLLEQQPGVIRKLVLIDTVAYLQPIPAFIRFLRTPLLPELVLSFIPGRTQARRGLQSTYFNAQEISEEAVAEYAKPLESREGRYALRKTARQMIPEHIDELSASYRQITVPVLLVWGREDEVVPLWVGERLNSELPDSRLCVIDRCGHIPQEEKPEETLKLVMDFMDERQEG